MTRCVLWLLVVLAGLLPRSASVHAQQSLGMGDAQTTQPRQGQEEIPMDQRPQDCAGCHALSEHDEYTLADGTKRSAYVDPDAHDASVHGEQVTCRDCHPRAKGYPHPPIAADTFTAYRRAQAATCSRCHYKTSRRLADSAHKEPAPDGSESPTCVTCHGGHEVFDPDSAPDRMVEACTDCHEEVAEAYAKSVHGRSLAEGGTDAPRCFDCHGSHAVERAQDDRFHSASYLICARCHGDAERMEKYDLSANVLGTYLDDFHGVSNHLYIEVGYVPTRPVATCADCHGYHDVAHLEAMDQGAVRERTAKMCSSCHKDADASFAGAWLGHSEPTVRKAPWMLMVIWGYRVLIPFMVLGMLLHIGLHFYRALMTHPDGSDKRR